MALTGMAIYKMLPRTNCGDCGFPTCMAFAVLVAQGVRGPGDCPYINGVDGLEYHPAAPDPEAGTT